MLFNGKISMQPKQEVLIERKVPTKVFAKLFHSLTQGLLSPKEKHQTFTAISILQELNIALRQAGITNIVRLAKDGNDFYFDEKGEDDDLADAMKEFRLNTDRLEETLFDDIYLVLEHKEDKLRYLIEVDIKRVHLAEEKPINITVNGVINELEKRPDESDSQLQSRVEKTLKNQKQYDAYVTEHRNQFDRFVASLEQTMRTAIRCEEVKQESKPQLVRPATKGATSVTDKANAPLAHRGYPGWEFAAIYTFLWMPAMTSASVQAADVDVINDSGNVLQNLTEEVDLTDSPLFDLDVDTSDLALDSDNRFNAGAYADGGSESTTSWLDFGDSSGGDGGSSCGSSCGGGCGS